MRIGMEFRVLIAAMIIVAGLSVVAAEDASTAATLATSTDLPHPVGRFVERQITDSSGPQRYTVYFPPGYSTEKRWPVILFLHGAGERGLDPASPTYAGMGPVLRHSPELYPCVVVFPQCETWDDRIFISWSQESHAGRRALAILDEVERTESIDSSHRSLTGWSMGGFGATDLAAIDPGHWRAVLSVAGGREGDIVEPLRNVPLWLIHGEKDSIVSIEKSRHLAKSLGLPTSTSRFDEVPAAGHEVWEQAYSDPRVAKWLLEGGTPPEIDWSIPPDPDRLPKSADGAPFIPAATVSDVVALRIGNVALQMLSAGIPESVKSERLKGNLPDIQQSFTTDGETYDLRLRHLTYAAKLESAELSAQATADILVELGVKLELRIGEATLSTRGFEARTGAFRIVIGHRRPVPLRLLVKPRLQDQHLHLTLKETAFPIPDDNWYVERPQEIQLSGTKFTRHEIETGIIGGLYTRKKEVEEQVRSVIPPLVERVEQRLSLDDSSQLSRWLWPFPVYQPRLHWTADSLTVDAQGLTVSLGAIVGASNTTAPREVRHWTGAALLPRDRQNSTNLHVVIDPLLMEVVSEEFAASGVARINVLDMPGTSFHELANPQRLRLALPNLTTTAEVRSVLALSSPFQFRCEPTSSGLGGVSRMIIPAAQLEVFSREGAAAPWSPAGQFSIALDQSIHITLEPKPTSPPLMGVVWSESPEVHFTSASTVNPQALLALELDMRNAWIGWSQSRNASPAPAQDFVIGDSRMRLDRLEMEPRSLVVDLVCPLAHLAVTGTTPLTYRIRSRNSYWSRPRTLEPGQSHRYETSDPLEWQVLGTREDTHSLRPGEVARWDQETDLIYEPPRSAPVNSSAVSTTPAEAK